MNEILNTVATVLGVCMIALWAVEIIQMRKTNDWEMFYFPKHPAGRAFSTLWMILFAASFFTPFIALNSIVATLGLIALQIYTMRRKQQLMRITSTQQSPSPYSSPAAGSESGEA